MSVETRRKQMKRRESPRWFIIWGPAAAYAADGGETCWPMWAWWEALMFRVTSCVAWKASIISGEMKRRTKKTLRGNNTKTQRGWKCRRSGAERGLTAKRVRMYAPAPTPMPITLLTLQRNQGLRRDWRWIVNLCTLLLISYRLTWAESSQMAAFQTTRPWSGSDNWRQMKRMYDAWVQGEFLNY